MIDYKIQVSGKEVLLSGVVTSLNGDDVVFQLDGKLDVRIIFEDNDDNTPKINYVVKVGNTEGIITLTNFKNPLGTEFKEDIQLGTFASRVLSLHIRVFGMDNTKNRCLIYTFYLGKEVENEQSK